jgi:hypothetical protein
MPSKIQFAPDDFVTKIVKDPDRPPATLLLRGFLGDASDPGHIRVYLDAELSRYIDAPRDAVLHVQQISEQHSPLGGQMVWLQRDAPLRRSPTASVAAGFLEGGLTAFPSADRVHPRQASRRPVEGVTDTCDPPPTEDASCATSMQQSTCVPETQPGSCYAPQIPRGDSRWLEGWGAPPRALVREETAQRCHS